MQSRRPTSPVLLALLLAATPVLAVDDLMPASIPRASALSEELDAPPRPPDGRLRLRLLWCDILHRTPFPSEVMSAEVERILGGENVDVTWRVLEDNALIFGDSEIRVILLDTPRALPSKAHHVMGSTPRDEGASRTAWAYSSTVLWALDLARAGAVLSPEQQQEFARALGRVVAHEVVHVIAPEIPHARQGLMQPGMNRARLLRPGLGLESAQRRTFEAQLASRTGAPAPLDRSAAAETLRRPLP